MDFVACVADSLWYAGESALFGLDFPAGGIPIPWAYLLAAFNFCCQKLSSGPEPMAMVLPPLGVGADLRGRFALVLAKIARE